MSCLGWDGSMNRLELKRYLLQLDTDRDFTVAAIAEISDVQHAVRPGLLALTGFVISATHFWRHRWRHTIQISHLPIAGNHLKPNSNLYCPPPAAPCPTAHPSLHTALCPCPHVQAMRRAHLFDAAMSS